MQVYELSFIFRLNAGEIFYADKFSHKDTIHCGETIWLCMSSLGGCVIRMFSTHPATCAGLCKFHFPVIHSPRLVSIDGRKLESREGSTPGPASGNVAESPCCSPPPPAIVCLPGHPILDYLSKVYITWWIMRAWLPFVDCLFKSLNIFSGKLLFIFQLWTKRKISFALINSASMSLSPIGTQLIFVSK